MLLGFYQIGKIVNNTNIFMTVLASTGISYASDIINFVIITAVLSAVNSCFYAANRMFYSLAQQGYAPKIFAGKYRQQQQVPKITILFTGAVIGITVVLNYLLPKTIVYYLLSFNSSSSLTVLVLDTPLFKISTVEPLRTQRHNSWTGGRPVGVLRSMN